MTLLFALYSGAFACPSLDAQLERATAAVISGDLAAVRLALAEADSSFACSPASSTGLGRYWLLHGAERALRGEDATEWLGASKRVAPMGFDPRLGPVLRAAFDAAPVTSAATLLLEPSLPAHLDGAPRTEWPAAVAAGPHLVQVVDAEGKVRFARVVLLLADEDALVSTQLAADAPLPPEPLPPKVARRAPVFLIAAAAAAIGGGAFAATALGQERSAANAATVDDVNAARDLQVVGAWGACGLWGVAAIGVGLHFVIP